MTPVTHFQAYLQLKNDATNNYKHYYIAVVQTSERVYILHTAYGRIGNVPTENKKKFQVKASALARAEKICTGKLVKNYLLEADDHTQATSEKPEWWNEAWVAGLEVAAEVAKETKSRLSSFFQRLTKTAPKPPARSNPPIPNPGNPAAPAARAVAAALNIPIATSGPSVVTHPPGRTPIPPAFFEEPTGPVTSRMVAEAETEEEKNKLRIRRTKEMQARKLKKAEEAKKPFKLGRKNAPWSF